jgi:hypothetical protein
MTLEKIKQANALLKSIDEMERWEPNVNNINQSSSRMSIGRIVMEYPAMLPAETVQAIVALGMAGFSGRLASLRKQLEEL